VSGLATPIPKDEFNGTGARVSYLFERRDTTVRGIHYETDDNRTSNCTHSPKCVSICRRHIELQYSEPCANQVSEHLPLEFARAHHA
jgi:hypothetical protein